MAAVLVDADILLDVEAGKTWEAEETVEVEGTAADPSAGMTPAGVTLS